MSTIFGIVFAVIVSFIAIAFVRGTMLAFNQHMPAIINAAKEDKPGAWIRAQFLVVGFVLTWGAVIWGVYLIWDWALTVG